MPSTPDAPPDTRDVPIQVALDFVNTLEHSRDSDTEHLVDPSSLVAWLAGHGLLDEPERVDEAGRFAAMPSEGKKALADARSLRQALRHVVDARVHATAARPRDIAVLNRWLRVPRGVRLVATPTGLSLVGAGGDRPLKRAPPSESSPRSCRSFRRARRCGGSPIPSRRISRARWSTPSTSSSRAGRVAAGHVEEMHEVEDKTVLVATTGQLWVDTRDSCTGEFAVACLEPVTPRRPAGSSMRVLGGRQLRRRTSWVRQADFDDWTPLTNG